MLRRYNAAKRPYSLVRIAVSAHNLCLSDNLSPLRAVDPGCQLTKEQLNELVPAIEIPRPKIPVIPSNAFLKLIPVNEMQKLGKNILP